MKARSKCLRIPVGTLAVLALTTLFAGCNGGSSSAPSPTPTLNPAPVTSPSTKSRRNPRRRPRLPTAKGSASCTNGAAPISTMVPVAVGNNTFNSPVVGVCSTSYVFTGITASNSVNGAVQLTAPAGLPTPPASGNNGPPTGFSLPVYRWSSTRCSHLPAISSRRTTKARRRVSTPLASFTPGTNFFTASWANTGPGTPFQFTGYGGNCNNPAPLTVSGNTLVSPSLNCPGQTFPNTLLSGGQTFVQAVVYF